MPFGIIRHWGKLGIYKGKSGHRTTLSFRESSSHWCGNLHRIPDDLSSYRLLYLPFRGILSREIVLLSRRLPRQCAHWLAMTGNSINSNFPLQYTVFYHYTTPSVFCIVAVLPFYRFRPWLPQQRVACLSPWDMLYLP